MALGRPSRGGNGALPGEPAVGPDLPPPFAAENDSMRWLFGLNRFGIRPGLVRIEGLLDDLGHPERDLATLVVAGTNGKGSATRALACLLGAAGHRVVTYTSPHLLGVRERIRIDDRPVAREAFAARVEAIRPSVEKHGASWFETLTALAVWIARDEGVDFFCCEAGLGGRLDASNALPAQAVVLTTVGLDHQRILGGTRQEILAEKLGLLKRGVPLFCGVDEDLRSQVFQAAVASGSPCLFLDEVVRLLPPASDGTWDLALRGQRLTGLPDPGTGFLRRDVALALLTLCELGAARGRDLLPADVPGALGNLFLPGRYQPVLSAPDWIFDTAHNEQALAGTLRQFTGEATGRRVILFAGMYDKDLPPELGPLLSRGDLIVAAPLSLPRSRTVDELYALLDGWGLQPRRVCSAADVDKAGCLVWADLAAALSWLADTLEATDRVLVTGSCFTVAEVLYKLGFDDLDDTRAVRPAPAVLARLKEHA